MLTGCASKDSSYDKTKFITDTKELLAKFEDVYNTGREYTTDEMMAVNSYEADYGEDSDFKGNLDVDVKLISNYTLLLYEEAKRLKGIDDNFAKDLAYVNDQITVVEKK